MKRPHDAVQPGHRGFERLNGLVDGRLHCAEVALEVRLDFALKVSSRKGRHHGIDLIHSGLLRLKHAVEGLGGFANLIAGIDPNTLGKISGSFDL